MGRDEAKGVHRRLDAMRRVLQRFFLFILWIGFFALWLRVLSTSTWSEFGRAWFYVGVFGIAYSLVLWAWIAHNRSIWRRKGPRTNVRPVNVDWSRDHLGRPVIADAAAWAAPFIRIHLRDGAKVYESLPLFSPPARLSLRGQIGTERAARRKR